MKKTLIIAEAGCNHNGKIAVAKKLINAAVFAGADIVKFQSFKTNELVTQTLSKAPYAKKTTNKNESQYNMQKKLELSESDHRKLINYCKVKKIEFLSSSFDIQSTILLKKLNLKRLKIPSGEITNYPNLCKIANLNKKIILSTGMSTVREIEFAIKTLIKFGTKKKNITLLHCNSEYPSPFKDINLRAIKFLYKAFKIEVGYSDHTLGIEVPIAAVAMGASVIEKHLTLDRKMQGPDHITSIEPDEFRKMVKSIRNVELSMGKEKKVVSKSEKKNIFSTRKSIVASKNIKIGEKFSINNISCKRSGQGISPTRWNKVIGKKAVRKYTKDQAIELA